MKPQHVPQDFYDTLMDLPNGADVTDLFECPDPEWKITNITLYKTEDPNSVVLSYTGVIAVEPVPAVEGS